MRGVREDALEGDRQLSTIADHGRTELDGRDVRSDALPLDRNEQRRRGVIVVVAVSAGMWAAIAAAAWAALQSLA
jgi:hypothetical protein